MEVKKDTGKFHLYGIFPDEIAKEFAAFLSIVTRRRIFAVGQIRYDGLPLEQEAELYQRSHFQEKQRLKEIKPPEIYNLLENLQAMDRRIVQGLILAMRLYHSAIEMIYTEPEFSYLFLVTCLEAISSVVYHEYKLSDEGDHPTELAIHGMEQADRSLATRNQFTAKKMLVHNEGFIFQKLFRFVAENVPKVFWTETEDDAKPDYLTAVIFPSSEGVGKEYISHSDITIQPWERIEEAHLKSCLRDIYKARSKLIHEGIQFPESIVVGHFRSVPVEAVEEMGHPLIPPLITFERLVSYSIREFLHRQKA
jgi:hypothetical protein